MGSQRAVIILTTVLPLNTAKGPGGALYAPPAGYGAESRRKSNFGISEAEKTSLVAWIMVILVWYKMSTAVPVLCGLWHLLRI